MGKRKSDETGPTFGERLHMWLSSAKILYTLLVALGAASAYGNSETVRDTVHRVLGDGDLPVADVVAPTETEGDAWRAQVTQSLTSIVSKLDKHEALILDLETKTEDRFKSIEQQSLSHDGSLQKQIDALKAWHE